MHKPGESRVIVLVLIRDGKQVLPSEGYDTIKKSNFYRILDCGVQFGEPSHLGLEGEFEEEIQADLSNIRY